MIYQCIGFGKHCQQRSGLYDRDVGRLRQQCCRQIAIDIRLELKINKFSPLSVYSRSIYMLAWCIQNSTYIAPCALHLKGLTWKDFQTNKYQLWFCPYNSVSRILCYISLLFKLDSTECEFNSQTLLNIRQIVAILLILDTHRIVNVLTKYRSHNVS